MNKWKKYIDYKVREKQGIVLKYISIHVSLCSDRGLSLD